MGHIGFQSVLVIQFVGHEHKCHKEEHQGSVGCQQRGWSGDKTQKIKYTFMSQTEGQNNTKVPNMSLRIMAEVKYLTAGIRN